MFGIPAWLFYGLSAVLAIALGLAYAAWRRANAPPDNRQLEELREQVKILSSSALGMAKRIERLATELRHLHDRIDGAEKKAPEPALYTQAIRMAERGIGVDELVENFGLARGEAELLQKLHSQSRLTP